jgi:hypothetical protein
LQWNPGGQIVALPLHSFGVSHRMRHVPPPQPPSHWGGHVVPVGVAAVPQASPPLPPVAPEPDAPPPPDVVPPVAPEPDAPPPPEVVPPLAPEPEAPPPPAMLPPLAPEPEPPAVPPPLVAVPPVPEAPAPESIVGAASGNTLHAEMARSKKSGALRIAEEITTMARRWHPPRHRRPRRTQNLPLRPRRQGPRGRSCAAPRPA